MRLAPSERVSVALALAALVVSIATSRAQAQEVQLGGAYAELDRRQQRLVGDWVTRFSEVTGKKVDAGAFYDTYLTLSTKTTFDAPGCGANGNNRSAGPNLLAENACIAYTRCMQYTIRGIPAAVDSALRERARADGKSLNEAVVDALSEGSGMAGAPRKRRNLGDIAGTWQAEKAVEAALAAQDRVDTDLWR